MGSHLTEALLAGGDQVVGIDSFTGHYARSDKEQNIARAAASREFELIQVDLVGADLHEVIGDSDGVFHLAAQPGVRGSWGAAFAAYVHDNVLATQSVFEAAAATGKHVVFASSSSVYGNAESYPTTESATPRPVSPYGVTKLTCEHLAEAYSENHGLSFAGLRYFTVYGPRQRPDMAFSKVIDALLRGENFTLFGTGEQTRDVTFVDDAVAATLAAMDTPGGGFYNIGGGSETTLSEALEILQGLSGRRLAVEIASAAAGDVQRTAADTTRARDELRWEPRTSLQDGLSRQLEWAIERNRPS